MTGRALGLIITHKFLDYRPEIDTTGDSFTFQPSMVRVTSILYYLSWSQSLNSFIFQPSMVRVCDEKLMPSSTISFPLAWNGFA